jgi:hypothetical protein
MDSFRRKKPETPGLQPGGRVTRILLRRSDAGGCAARQLDGVPARQTLTSRSRRVQSDLGDCCSACALLRIETT